LDQWSHGGEENWRNLIWQSECNNSSYSSCSRLPPSEIAQCNPEAKYRALTFQFRPMKEHHTSVTSRKKE
jgi:hypothetical protein